MSVDHGEVSRIAELARLRLSTSETERLTSELNEILEHMEILRGLPGAGDGDTAGAEALPSTRVDEDGTPDPLSTPPADFAPLWASGFFVVPPPPGVQHEEEAE